MQQMAIDMEKIGISAHASDDVLIPDLGEQRTARFPQGSPPFGFSRPAASAATRRFCTACGSGTKRRLLSKHDRPSRRQSGFGKGRPGRTTIWAPAQKAPTEPENQEAAWPADRAVPNAPASASAAMRASS